MKLLELLSWARMVSHRIDGKSAQFKLELQNQVLLIYEIIKFHAKCVNKCILVTQVSHKLRASKQVGILKTVFTETDVVCHENKNVSHICKTHRSKSTCH